MHPKYEVAKPQRFDIWLSQLLKARHLCSCSARAGISLAQHKNVLQRILRL